MVGVGRWAAVLAVLALTTVGCVTDDTLAGPASTSTPALQPTEPAQPAATRKPRVRPTPAATEAEPAAPAGPTPSDGRPVDATISIPDIGVRNVTVAAYTGVTDDTAGTVIQDQGIAASPSGVAGGTGAGGVGNYLVTGHRNSAGALFFDLPSLDRGDVIEVAAEGVVYVYEVAETRETSFRSEESLRQQRAAVPGRPGVAPTQAMITVSTCATQEDHAAGNDWSDANDNPEHRIDKVGVLVSTRPAR